MRLLRQRGRGRKPPEEFDRLSSTDSAVGNAAEDILYLTGPELGVDCRDWRQPTQSTIWTLEPAHDALMVTEAVMSQRDNASQPVKSIRFKTG